MSQPLTATIRMYRLIELGDCFLLTFKAGAATSRMLIDCGSFRNVKKSIDRLKAIADSIRTELGGAPLDVVVGTHQHNDHVNAFLHCEQAFRSIGVEQVWLSWLDDPTDAAARAIGKDYHNLRVRIAAARDALQLAMKGQRATHAVAARTLRTMNDMLAFFGAADAGTPPEVPADAVKILKTLGNKTPRYLRPGETVDLPGLPAGSVRIHVLGPPRDEEQLFRKDPRADESYDPSLTSAGMMATKFDAAVTGLGQGTRKEPNYPFNDEHKKTEPIKGSAPLADVVRRYRAPSAGWRTIDDDWLQQGERLSLYLDTFTNNSSLVLAIELVDSGKVLLFVADAQTGNWSSWQDVTWQLPGVTVDALLARTVFYKVGHHASHNATLVQAFEKMTNPDLVALIPVHKMDPNITKPNGWRMPATHLFERIVEKTEHRVLQMDDDNPPDCRPNLKPAKAAWSRVGIKPRITDLSIEVDIAG